MRMAAEGTTSVRGTRQLKDVLSVFVGLALGFGHSALLAQFNGAKSP
jgi:hypothetical protein